MKLIPDFTKPQTRKKFYIIAGAVVFLSLFTMFISGIPVSTNPSLCGNLCHAPRFDYQTWQSSSHVEVPCFKCHGDRSYIGIYKERIVESTRRLALTLTNTYEKPLNADSSYSKTIPSSRCLACHSPETRKFTGRRGLRVSGEMHTKHLKAGLVCTTCHNRVAHRGGTTKKYQKLTEGGFKYKNFMDMGEGCLRCHSDDERFKDTEALDILGSKVPPKGCRVCHEEGWDMRPKNGEANHLEVRGVPWKNGVIRHGKLAAKDFNSCFECHPADGVTAKLTKSKLPNCATTCHKGVGMPHNIPKWSGYFTSKTPKWMKNHRFQARKYGSEACQVCHKSSGSGTEFCQKCHHEKFYKEMPDLSDDWKAKEGGMKYVKEKGAYACWQCHEASFCSYCHVTGKKPPLKSSLKKK